MSSSHLWLYPQSSRSQHCWLLLQSAWPKCAGDAFNADCCSRGRVREACRAPHWRCPCIRQCGSRAQVSSAQGAARLLAWSAAEGGRAADAERGVQLWRCRGDMHTQVRRASCPWEAQPSGSIWGSRHWQLRLQGATHYGPSIQVAARHGPLGLLPAPLLAQDSSWRSRAEHARMCTMHKQCTNCS